VLGTEFEADCEGKLFCGNVAIFLPLKTQLIQSQTMEIFLTVWYKPESTTRKQQCYHPRCSLGCFWRHFSLQYQTM